MKAITTQLADALFALCKQYGIIDYTTGDQLQLDALVRGPNADAARAALAAYADAPRTFAGHSRAPWSLTDQPNGERHLVSAGGNWIATLHGGYTDTDSGPDTDDCDAALLLAAPYLLTQHTGDPLTIAYIALGARTALELAFASVHQAEHAARAVDAAGGQLGFIGDIIGDAAMLDHLAHEASEVGLTGVFAYDVAEGYGEVIAMSLISDTEVNRAAVARRLVKEATT